MITDANGLPLLVHTTPANVRDDQPTLAMVARMPAIQGPRGRPRRKPTALCGDRGYGFPYLIAAIVTLGIVSMLSPRGAEHGGGLGTVRYVVERTLAWFGHARRLKLCYERTGVHFQAFHDLAACLICANRLKRFNEL